MERLTIVVYHVKLIALLLGINALVMAVFMMMVLVYFAKNAIKNALPVMMEEMIIVFHVILLFKDF